MEVLARAKRKDTGEWVFGFYSKEPDGKEYILADIGDTWDCMHLLSYVDVIPETIGHYSNKKDIDGNKIFEDDALGGDSHWGMYVKFEDGAFRAIPLNKVQRNNWKHHVLDRNVVEELRIIGNLHDNPEFLEV